MNILFTRELARRLDGTGVTANAVHPGFVASRFSRDGDTGFMGNVGMVLGRPFARSPESGARTSVFVASSPQLDGVTGQYFAKSKLATSRPQRLVTTSRRLDSGMSASCTERRVACSSVVGRWTGRPSSSPGGNSGIGLETAVALGSYGVRRRHHRAQRGSGRRRAARDRSPGAATDCEVMALDLASFASVRALRRQLRRPHDRLDVLVLNAGGVLAKRELTEDGHERQFQANHLGHFLLTRLLREQVVASAPGTGRGRRVVRAQEPQTPDRLRRHRRRRRLGTARSRPTTARS